MGAATIQERSLLVRVRYSIFKLHNRYHVILSAAETNFSAGNQPSEMSLLQSIIADFPLRETRVLATVKYLTDNQKGTCLFILLQLDLTFY